MKQFTTCYIVEISGNGKSEHARIEHLRHSADVYIKTMLSNFGDLILPESETITIRVGKISCNEKKNIKEHLCLKKIKLQALDK